MMFEHEYRNVFTALGRPIIPADGITAEILTEAEQRVGCRIPDALRAFYLVAGRAEDYTCIHDRFLAPHDWWIDSGKLVFMEENQMVVYYGIGVSSDLSADPPVLMAANDEPLEWYQICGSCSEFIRVILHWAGAFGGAMAATGTAMVDPSIKEMLDKDWTCLGEVNAMWAYSKPNRTVCCLQWDVQWRVFAGGSSEGELTAIARELGLTLENIEDAI